VEWTAHGIKAIREMGYKYISPYVLRFQDTGEVVGFLSAALTHDPDLVNPPNIFVPHSGGMENAREIATRLLDAETHTQTKQTEDPMPQWLLELLGLDKNATEDQIKAAAHSLRDKAQKKPEDKIVDRIPVTVITALGLKTDASETEIVGSIHSLKGTAAGAGDLAKRLALLEGKSAQAEADKIISEAHSAGKLTESMVEWAKKEVVGGRLDQLKGFLANAPVIVPLGQRKALTTAEHAAHGRGEDAAVLDETQSEVNRQLGVSDEKFTKHFTGSKN
jgi:phage I-like protein